MARGVESAVSEYLAEIGRKGGTKKVAKGFARMSRQKRQEAGRKGAAARWGKSRKAGGP